MSLPILKKLEDQLNCSICLETYTNPKQLQCHHVYCQQCLAKLVFRDQQGQLILSCPNCRQVTPVPACGVAGLHTAFRVNQLLEIVEEQKKIVNLSSNASTTQKSISIACPDHEGKEVELYCDTCSKTICWKCIKVGEKHHSHKYEELSEAFEHYKKEMASLLKPVEDYLSVLNKSLSQVGTCCEELLKQQVTIEASIHSSITRLHEIMEVRKTELINQLHQLTQAKLKSLKAQKDKLETDKAQLASCLDIIRENLKTSKQAETLQMKSTTVKQMEELTATTFQPGVMLEPNMEADMIFSALPDLSTVCKNYGLVYAEGSPDPSKCYVIGGVPNKAEVEEKCNVVIETLNSASQPCKLSLSSILCELVSELGESEFVSVERRQSSQSNITYQATMKGRHQLHVKVEGQHIDGSPFPVSVTLPVQKLGIPILSINSVRGPHGVAVNQRGQLVVSEGDDCCATLFSSKSEIIKSFGQGLFRCPVGVAFDTEDNIYIADYDNHTIQKFTSCGTFCATVGTKGNGSLQFQNPYGLAFNVTNSRVYVADSGNSRIQTLNSDLSFHGMFGKKESGNGKLYLPGHIACDSTGNVYVVDKRKYIQVFTSEGIWLKEFIRGKTASLSGIAVDFNDRVYVSSWDNHCISVITLKRELLTTFGHEGEGPGELKNPCGLAVDSSGVVYVCDCGNMRVQLF